MGYPRDPASWGQRTVEMDKSSRERKMDRLRGDIDDLKLCLAGNSQSKRWWKIKIELDALESTLRCQKEKEINIIPAATREVEYGPPRRNI